MDEAKLIVKALNRIADAIQEQAEATRILAAATAGEFDGEPEQEENGGLS